MGVLFSGKELIDIAVGIERRGKIFYETMVKCARDKKARTAFTYLADEENEHIGIYQKMLASVADNPPPESYTEEYDEYLKSLVNSAVFANDASACSMAENTTGDIEGIDLGIRAEKDSILFYTGIRGLVRRSQAKLIDRIIKEEQSHLKRLSEVKAGLARIQAHQSKIPTR